MATDYVAPDYMEPLIGWRYWWLNPWAEAAAASMNWFIGEAAQRVAAPHDGLRSMVLHGPVVPPPAVWPNDAPLTAKCYCVEVGVNRHCDTARCSTVPSDRGIDACTGYFPCGIYAWRDKERLLEAIRRTNYFYAAFAFGAVRLWGVVRPHEHGYRAQYAYPDRIIYATAGHNVAQALADHYRIPYDYDKEAEREYRRAETHYYRRTGQVPNSRDVAITCGDPNCTVCTNDDAYSRPGLMIGSQQLATQYQQAWAGHGIRIRQPQQWKDPKP